MLVFFLAIAIGVLLGLIGGGGSILTVPVLVYLAGVSPVLATAYSLFIVGSTSMVGAFTNMFKKLVHIPTALVFAIPSLAAVYSVRKYAVPLIPDVIFSLGNFVVTKRIFIMVFFAVVMLTAGLTMILKRKNNDQDVDLSKIKFNYPLIILSGLTVGVLTSLVGAGGGFLIVPALAAFVKLPMRLTVGTSLLIIAINSLVGFTGDMQNIAHIMDWKLLTSFTSAAIGGFFAGAYFAKFIQPSMLQKGFGWFVLVMAIFIMTKELIG